MPRKIDREKMDLSYELERLARGRLEHFIFELGGHNLRGSVSDYYRKDKVADLWMADRNNSVEDIRLVTEATRNAERAEKPLRFGKTCLDICYICGRKIGITFDGKVFGSETVCPYPDGLPEYSMRFAVPSGKIVAGNDFRDEYEPEAPDSISDGFSFGKKLESFKFNVNTEWGQRQVFMFYAKRGMAHGFVGNTCPGVFRLADGRLTISQCRYDKKTYENKDPPGERVGGIGTDLWWYSLADHDDLARRRNGEAVTRFDCVINVEPGIYRVTHRYHKVDNRSNITDHYAIIKKVR